MNDQVQVDSHISHYRIISKIGSGGMGVVYRAADERLAREVAIKLLPADVANDVGRLQRFEQEAKATSALNHPNILTVYDIGDHNGAPFIVSELLEGEELRDRLNEGPIPLRKTIDYAQQVVSGLAAAHERGITHRDLKPENLFITKDDRVKILDFGLAKLRERTPTAESSEALTQKALTDPGMVMGTAGYMSPEQVRGQAVDHRSDIFSFGVIFYEMLTGSRAFGGESVVETMHSILKEDVPELSDSGIRVPPPVEKLMRRCLEKKPDHRFHSAHDLGFALDAVASPTDSSGTNLTIAARSLTEVSSTSRRSWIGPLAWALAALFMITTIVFAVLYYGRTEQSGDAMRFSIAPPEKSLFNEAFALSPNGKMIAFVARGESGDNALWVRQLAAVDAKQLSGTEGAAFPFWSPDGRTIAFFAGGKLRKIDAGGGPAQTLADASSDPRGGSWAQDGTIVFSPGTSSPLMRVASTGGPVSEITKLNSDTGQLSHRWPVLLPDGRHFLFYGRGGVFEKQGIYVASFDQPEPKLVLPSSVMASYAQANGQGYLLFVLEGTLVAQRFDPVSLTLSGDVKPLVEHLLSFPGEVGPTAYSAFSAAGGNLVYRTGNEQNTRLTWFDRNGKRLEPITELATHHEPVLTKDGTKVLYGRSETDGMQDVYIQDLVRGSIGRLTFDSTAESTPVLSPDESQFAFSSNRNSTNGIYVKSTSGAGAEEPVFVGGEGVSYADSWSPDGKYILCDHVGDIRTKVGLWIIPMFGDHTPTPYFDKEFSEGHGQFSPDGKWVAYSSDESGRAEVYIQSFPIGNGKWQISTIGGDQPQWRGDGKELYYMTPDGSLMAVTIESGSTLSFGKPVSLFVARIPFGGIGDDKNNYVPTRDGQRFLVNTLPDDARQQTMVLVLNWASELKK